MYPVNMFGLQTYKFHCFSYTLYWLKMWSSLRINIRYFSISIVLAHCYITMRNKIENRLYWLKILLYQWFHKNFVKENLNIDSFPNRKVLKISVVLLLIKVNHICLHPIFTYLMYLEYWKDERLAIRLSN